DLQAHTARGIDPNVALRGVHQALATSEARYRISSGLILTFLRHLPGADAMDAYQQAVGSGVPLLGVGLCSTEIGFPVVPFAEVFDRARADGLHTVAHAGEEGDAGYVREALDVLKVERVDHGVRAIEDPRLIDRLVADQTPLTMCPLSNVRLKVVPTLAAHPIVDLLRHGVKVTVNSDDPAYFGGYLDDVVAALRTEFNLTDADIDRLARNSIEASFAPESERARLLAE
ncbi:MAG: adenosine deaminase, partial [Propionibacteriaceae bacterium]|nr:adenosine deaminase [Propionibacteriaceae bacterium]